MLKIKTTKFIPRWLLITAIVFFIVIILTIGSYLAFEKKYKNKIYPGLFLGQLDLSGKTYEEAQSAMNQETDKINKNGITFYYQNHKTAIFPIVASLESDLAYRIINFNVPQAATEAVNFGRENNFFINLQNKLKAIVLKHPIILSATINKQEINKLLKKRFSQFEIPAEDAKLKYEKNNLSGLEEIDLEGLKISEEKLGKIINYKSALKQLQTNLAQLNASPVQLSTKTDYPLIYKREVLNIKAQAKQVLNLAPLILSYEQKEWVIEKARLANWLSLKINPEFGEMTDSEQNDKVIIGLSAKAIEQFLQEEAAPSINKEPIEAKFEIKDGRVVEFQDSRDGIKLDERASIAKIEFEFINNKKNKVDLAVKILKSKVSAADINNLGIKEIIGTGESIFAGSPSNRRHNIKTGANALNGLLIKPGEEFSLLNALGDIDASSGYLQELVIKGNETIPEYGGGLCQIGTTMFRSVLASGLPVTKRRNHSYRVSYYEPAGTDATIYDPWPDFKFINDTGNHILIQSRIEGDKIYFDFWGTKDGRAVKKTEPIIYNIVKPEPTKLLETLDLPPGEKKCTERAHNGADAYFDYKVTYANGEVKEKRFNSHYIPWQEVCLIGVEKLSGEETAENATSTEEIYNSNASN